PWWLSGKISTLGPKGSRFGTRFHLKPIAIRKGPNAFPLLWCGFLERGLPAQSSGLLPSSSDCGSKFRDLSENSLVLL
ncbi:hypothetical protein AVEN_203132-1, partial [Araneus ventricosus]